MFLIPMLKSNYLSYEELLLLKDFSISFLMMKIFPVLSSVEVNSMMLKLRDWSISLLKTNTSNKLLLMQLPNLKMEHGSKILKDQLRLDSCRLLLQSLSASWKMKPLLTVWLRNFSTILRSVQLWKNNMVMISTLLTCLPLKA